MQGIGTGSLGNRTLCYETFRQCDSLLRHCQNLQFREDFETRTCGYLVSSRSLPVHKLRDQQLEMDGAIIPPLARELLMSGHNSTRARSPTEIAHNRCLYVDTALHILKYTAGTTHSKLPDRLGYGV